MRVTVCELPHEPGPLAAAWARLCEHSARESSDFILLPELACVPPLWQKERFDSTDWGSGLASSGIWSRRFGELHAAHVVGTRPITIARRHFNQGFMWSKTYGLMPLRRKYFLPNESGGWEAHWFTRGDRDFPRFTAGTMSFGLNICTELWALETYAAYAAMGVHAVVCPRATSVATATKWLAAGIVAAVRSGAYCLSSNRVHSDGSCGGSGWIISPDGELLASTSPANPVCTFAIDLGVRGAASTTYPRYVFAGGV